MTWNAILHVLKWSIWSNWKIILEITLTPHIPACVNVNQGNWSHQTLKTIRLHLPNSLRGKTIQNHTTSLWWSCIVFVLVVVWLLWFSPNTSCSNNLQTDIWKPGCLVVVNLHKISLQMQSTQHNAQCTLSQKTNFGNNRDAHCAKLILKMRFAQNVCPSLRTGPPPPNCNYNRKIRQK